MSWMKHLVTRASTVKKSCCNKEIASYIQQRFLSSSEVSVALRPFYFAVHPDLFEQHPTERDVNENSLKQLNNYIETILHQKPASSAKVKFFLRKQKPSDRSFRAVNISLDHRKDIRGALQTILSSCSLPTNYVDNLPKSALSSKKLKFAVKGISDIYFLIQPSSKTKSSF